MGADSKIEWTHHTFNPWWGCEKVSAGCKNCYAETFARRVGHNVWGPGGQRRTFGDKHWAEPLKWNSTAEKAGENHRVFCASMADVFEHHPIAHAQRPRLWSLIQETPWLTWLLLTKRPENVRLYAPWGEVWPANVWLGTTIEDNQSARKRLDWLRGSGASTVFVSAEPLLEEPMWDPVGVDWVIWGGESGHGARPCELEWIRKGIEMCRRQRAAPFVKQVGSNAYLTMDGHKGTYETSDSKGGDWDEWPDDIRVREFPK